MEELRQCAAGSVSRARAVPPMDGDRRQPLAWARQPTLNALTCLSSAGVSGWSVADRHLAAGIPMALQPTRTTTGGGSVAASDA